MRCNLLLLALVSTMVLAGAAGAIRAQGPDPAILNMDYTTSWRYRDPYAKREFAITLANVGDTAFESIRGKQWVRIYVREVSPMGGSVHESPAVRLPFERLAAGEEVILHGQYFQEIERGRSPESISYRAEIVYDATLADSRDPHTRDVNLANNKARPEAFAEITLVPRLRR